MRDIGSQSSDISWEVDFNPGIRVVMSRPVARMQVVLVLVLSVQSYLPFPSSGLAAGVELE